MQQFTVNISLNDEDMENIKRLNALTKESAPDLFGNDTLKDTVGFVARYEFEKTLQKLLWGYQNDSKEEGGNV